MGKVLDHMDFVWHQTTIKPSNQRVENFNQRNSLFNLTIWCFAQQFNETIYETGERWEFTKLLKYLCWKL